MKNRDSLNIAKFGFLNSIKSKGFIVFNVILLIGIIIAINFSTVKTIFQSKNMFKGEQYKIYIIDDTDYILSAFENDKPKSNVESVEKVGPELLERVNSFEKKEILVEVLENEQGKYLKITSREGIDSDVYDYIVSLTGEIKNQEIETKYGMSREDVEKYKSDIYIERNIIEKDSVVDNKYYVLTMAMTMLIYSLIIFGTNAVASQIANEKTSKSAEYIFSSVSSKSYLNGKVIGANLKTVANMLLIIFYIVLGIVINSFLVKTFNISLNSGGGQTQTIGGYIGNIDVKIIKYIGISFVYILLTSILLSYLQASMTAKVKSINEMDNSQSITLTIIVVAYVLAMLTNTKNNLFTKIIANIPILSMFTMPNNYLGGVASWKTIVPSLGILLITIIITMNRVGKNFKNDILDLRIKKNSKNNEKEMTEDNEENSMIKQEQRKIEQNKMKSFSLVTSISLISLILTQLVLGLATMFLFPNVSTNINIMLISTIFVLSFVIPIYMFKSLSSGNNVKECKAENIDKKAVSNKEKIKYFFTAVPIVFVVQYLVEFVIGKLGVDPAVIEGSIVFENTVISKILLFTQLAILPAIFEELFFRKIMLNEAKKFGIWFGIGFTAIAFGLIHMNITQGINAALLGVLLAYITLKTKSILPAMGIHLFNNGLAALGLMWANNDRMIMVLEYVKWISIAVGLIIILRFIKDRKSFKLQGIQKNNINIKYVLGNYYMITLIVFIVFMFAITY